ncbi:ParB-like nuclease protein [Rhizobium phage RHph_I4]|nr:ParB-like nuclease protein [Rhizobium phage RHph_I4]
MKITLEQRALGSLKPYERNSKNHGDGDVEAIAASITRFGFNDPVGITPDGTIVEGHGRYEAAHRLGLETVPVVVLEGATERQIDLYRIAHNKIALSTGFDFEVLVDTLREVSENGEVQVADMGFSMEAYDNLCQMFAPNEARAARQAGSRPQSHEYDIIFDNKEQKDVFSKFLKKLKAESPDLEEGTAFLRWARQHVGDVGVEATQTEEQHNG